MNISSFYRLLHLFNTFLQIGKTFFTSEPYYIHKSREATKKIHQGKEDQKMKNRKKYFIIGAVILFFGALAGLGVTVASGPHGSWHRGFHHGFHEEFADFILWRMDRHVKDLNLDETQMQEYERIREEVKGYLTEAMEKRRDFHGILVDEISKEKPDIDALANLVKERMKNVPDFLSKHLDLFVEFYNILDENQKAQVIERLRYRMG